MALDRRQRLVGRHLRLVQRGEELLLRGVARAVARQAVDFGLGDARLPRRVQNQAWSAGIERAGVSTMRPSSSVTMNSSPSARCIRSAISRGIVMMFFLRSTALLARSRACMTQPSAWTTFVQNDYSSIPPARPAHELTRRRPTDPDAASAN